MRGQAFLSDVGAKVKARSMDEAEQQRHKHDAAEFGTESRDCTRTRKKNSSTMPTSSISQRKTNGMPKSSFSEGMSAALMSRSPLPAKAWKTRRAIAIPKKPRRWLVGSPTGASCEILYPKRVAINQPGTITKMTNLTARMASEAAG